MNKNETNTTTHRSNLRRTLRALETKTVRTVTTDEGNERWGLRIIVKSSNQITIRTASHWRINNGDVSMLISADNGHYFTAAEVAEKLKAAIETIGHPGGNKPTSLGSFEWEHHAEFGLIVRHWDCFGTDHVYRVGEGDVVEVRYMREWVPASTDGVHDLNLIVAAYHHWIGDVHA